MDAIRISGTWSFPRFARLLAATTLSLSTVPVSADERATSSASSVTEASPELDEQVTAEDHPFAFLVDPSTPSAGVFSLGYGLGLGSGISSDRPIPMVLQNQGVSSDFSLGYGVTSSFEGIANLTVNSNSSTHATTGNGFLGAKIRLTSPDAPFRAAVLAGALSEGGSARWGAWARATGSFTTGPLLFEANAYLEHVFAPGRDAMDYIGMLGASTRVAPALRVGAEYVGQDLEEISASGAEGGARMGAGPSVALDLYQSRFQITVAALFGLTGVSPSAIVRAGVLGSF